MGIVLAAGTRAGRTLWAGIAASRAITVAFSAGLCEGPVPFSLPERRTAPERAPLLRPRSSAANVAAVIVQRYRGGRKGKPLLQASRVTGLLDLSAKIRRELPWKPRVE